MYKTDKTLLKNKKKNTKLYLKTIKNTLMESFKNS